MSNDPPRPHPTPEPDSATGLPKKVDLSLIRRIVRLTLPVAMGGHAETVVGMIQLFLVGLLGLAALSAVGIAQAFTRVLFTAMMAISRGALTMVAQAIGADSMEQASATAKQAFALLFGFSILFGVCSLRRNGLAYGTVATALVGQSLGAKDPDAAERNGWTTLLISVITNVLLSLPALLFARQFMGLFTDAPDVIDIGVIYLLVMVLAEPFVCASNTSSGSLRGAGDTMPPMYYTLISEWLVRLPAAYTLAFALGYGLNGIWAALVVSGILQAFLTVRKFSQGTWKTKVISLKATP